jgi:hypothetical protein
MENVIPIKKMVGPYGEIVNQMRRQRANALSVWYLVIVALLSFCLGIIATVFAPSQVWSLRA